MKPRLLLHHWPLVVLPLTVVLVAPWQMSDPDTLSHLAIGRVIVQSHHVPTTDPFTYPAVHQRWSNPEWLGDVLWYSLYRLGGEKGAQLGKLALLALGWSLVFLLARKQGAAASICLGLLLLALLGAPPRFTMRNHIHAYWLVPLYGLLLQHGRERWSWLLLLLPAGVLWSNLHGSFVVGWAVLLAGLVQYVLHEQRNKQSLIALTVILTLHPLLPLLGPQGIDSYRQLAEHLWHAAIYRDLILEWQPPSRAISSLTSLPLHLLSVLGLLSYLPQENRRQASSFLLLLLGLAFGYSSQRFVPLMAVLTIPGTATNLSRWLERSASRFRWFAQICTPAIALALLTPIIIGLRSSSSPHVLSHQATPVAAAHFLARHAPAGSRLFNPYNAGPWLLWLATPAVQIHIDPRNNQGAVALQTFFESTLSQPTRFEKEVQRQQIGLALIDLSEGRMGRLNEHLTRSTAWKLVYLDGRYALHARQIAKNDRLLGRFAFSRLQARLSFEYLLRPVPPEQPPEQPHQVDPALAHTAVDHFLLLRDQRQLAHQGPALAGALEAYRLLCADRAPPPLLRRTFSRQASKRARKILDESLPALPPSPELLTYLATAWARQGNRSASQEVLQIARRLFPQAPLPLALELELQHPPRSAPKTPAVVFNRNDRRWEPLHTLAPSDHPIWRILADGGLQVP